MVDFWRDFWIRVTGTGQQVAQLHDRYDEDDDDDDDDDEEEEEEEEDDDDDDDDDNDDDNDILRTEALLIWIGSQ